MQCAGKMTDVDCTAWCDGEMSIQMTAECEASSATLAAVATSCKPRLSQTFISGLALDYDAERLKHVVDCFNIAHTRLMETVALSDRAYAAGTQLQETHELIATHLEGLPESDRGACAISLLPELVTRIDAALSELASASALAR
jgi:hypothetical protein